MSEVRRVLLVEPMQGARWRSITAYASSIAEVLRLSGLEVETAEAPWFNPPSIASGLRRRWWRAPAIQRAIAGHYDVVHLTDHALAHHAPRFGRVSPVVVTCHDVMPFTLPSYYATGRERRLKQTFLRRPYAALAQADLVISVSEFTRGELSARFPALEVEVVPNTVRAAFRPAARDVAEAALREAGMELPPGPRVLSVGNDRAYKNLPALIEAMAHPALAHASLVRVGPFTPGQRQLAAASGVLRRTVFPAGPSDEQLALLCAAADVLVQPSFAEGFGLPVVEAMACGLPVVVSDGGALPELVGAAGVVVPLSGPDFPGRLAASVAGALQRRQELAEAGLLRAREFAPGAILPRLLGAYERAHRSSRRGRGDGPERSPG